MLLGDVEIGTEEVLRDIGYDNEALTRLRAAGAIL